MIQLRPRGYLQKGSPDLRTNTGPAKETFMADKYTVRPLKDEEFIRVNVPGSKSITNRALLLAAMGQKKCLLNGVLFSDDSRAFLNCLRSLGFTLTVNEAARNVEILGTGGLIPDRNASINVGSAGTAARFLTVFLAFAGGSFTLDSSAQMRRRPMEPLISVLRQAGVTINCLEKEGHFPFTLSSNGINADMISIDTDISSQFASAILMAAPLLDNGLTVKLTGERTHGSYINITLRMMEQFRYTYLRNGDMITVYGAGKVKGGKETVTSYQIEPDVSAAGYFYAMSPICGRTVQVNGIHKTSMQGDIRFLDALKALGCMIMDDEEGIIVKPPADNSYKGLDINMKDYSDQTMTMAAVASFASSPTTIRDIGHIRAQESDRLSAIVTELNRLGCICRIIDEGTGLYIEPMPMHGCDIETYEDHRIAMAFTLIGLRIPGVSILNPGCSSKTFEDYFDIIDSLCI